MKTPFLLFVALAVSALAFTHAVESPAGLSIGDVAPDFELPATDGKMYSLASITDAKGKQPKGYIVTFTCNTCPFAQANEDRLIALHKDMAPKGWPVVAIQPNDPVIQPGDNMANMKKRAAEKGFPFLYLLDDGQEIYPRYGASYTPHVFLLDKDRKTLYIGAIDDSPRNPDGAKQHFVRDAIEAHMAGKKIDPDMTKAVGCSIKAR